MLEGRDLDRNDALGMHDSIHEPLSIEYGIERQRGLELLESLGYVFAYSARRHRRVIVDVQVVADRVGRRTYDRRRYSGSVDRIEIVGQVLAFVFRQRYNLPLGIGFATRIETVL